MRGEPLEVFEDTHDRDIQVHIYEGEWIFLKKNHAGIFLQKGDLAPLAELFTELSKEYCNG